MLTKNVGYALKNVDEKMLATLNKKCWQKIFATFQKNVDEKIMTAIQKNIK
jgi:hypothetical protein